MASLDIMNKNEIRAEIDYVCDESNGKGLSGSSLYQIAALARELADKEAEEEDENDTRS